VLDVTLNDTQGSSAADHSLASAGLRWTSFAALGDSFTEGLDDQRGDGSYRGWADLVAADLASRQPGLRYANLAVRGRLMSQIVAEQVPRALAMRPDLVSLVGGVNDMLRPSFDIGALHRTLDRAVGQLRESGSDVMLVVGVNPTARSKALARLMPRVVALNETVAAVAERWDCYPVDLFDADVFDDQRMWAPDRLHLSTAGHERVAGAYLQQLGLGDDSWRVPLPSAGSPSFSAARRDDAQWLRAHLVPWIARRATGDSSGRAVVAKHPDLGPVCLEGNL
jgi:lysophospholipase L1-like esterase